MNNIVNNIEDLYKIKNPQENEIYCVKNLKEYFTYKNNKWEQIIIKNDLNPNINLSLYDLNKSLFNQMNGLNNEELQNKYKIFEEYKENTNNNFYMLYGKEISYFTLFQKDIMHINSFAQEVVDCLKDVGEIIDIDFTENKDAIECWVKSYDNNNEATCLYLFPYDSGIVKYGG